MEKLTKTEKLLNGLLVLIGVLFVILFFTWGRLFEKPINERYRIAVYKNGYNDSLFVIEEWQMSHGYHNNTFLWEPLYRNNGYGQNPYMYFKTKEEAQKQIDKFIEDYIHRKNSCYEREDEE